MRETLILWLMSDLNKWSKVRELTLAVGRKLEDPYMTDYISKQCPGKDLNRDKSRSRFFLRDKDNRVLTSEISVRRLPTNSNSISRWWWISRMLSSICNKKQLVRPRLDRQPWCLINPRPIMQAMVQMTPWEILLASLEISSKDMNEIGINPKAITQLLSVVECLTCLGHCWTMESDCIRKASSRRKNSLDRVVKLRLKRSNNRLIATLSSQELTWWASRCTDLKLSFSSLASKLRRNLRSSEQSSCTRTSLNANLNPQSPGNQKRCYQSVDCLREGVRISLATYTTMPAEGRSAKIKFTVLAWRVNAPSSRIRLRLASTIREWKTETQIFIRREWYSETTGVRVRRKLIWRLITTCLTLTQGSHILILRLVEDLKTKIGPGTKAQKLLVLCSIRSLKSRERNLKTERSS